MNRGEIWTVAGGSEYTTKPRPAVILQDDTFDDTDSITLCPVTSDPTDASYFRVVVEPTAMNNLTMPASIMVDKITTVRRNRLRTRIGALTGDDLRKVGNAIAVFLGLATPRS